MCHKWWWILPEEVGGGLNLYNKPEIWVDRIMHWKRMEYSNRVCAVDSKEHHWTWVLGFIDWMDHILLMICAESCVISKLISNFFKKNITLWDMTCPETTFTGNGYSTTCQSTIRGNTCTIACSSGYKGDAVDVPCGFTIWGNVRPTCTVSKAYN